MADDYHQISAFVAASVKGSNAKIAYAVYDNGDLVVTRGATIRDISEHRALLMATWSAVSYCKANLPQHALAVYSVEKHTGNELTSVWIGESVYGDHEDRDRILSIVRDCCFIKQVSFGACPMEEEGVFADYTRRMQELQQMVNK